MSLLLKFKIYFLLILVSNSFLSLAQNKINLGIKAGINRCQVLGDGHKGYYKNGFEGGLFLKLKIQKDAMAQIELLFSDKGSQSRPKDYTNKTLSEPYSIRLYYIDFPLIFQYIHKKLFYQTGLGTGYLLEQWEYIPGRAYSDVLNRFNKIDPNFIIGLGYKYSEHLGLDFRFTNSILPIRKIPSKQYNSLFSLSIYYQFAIKNKIE